MKQTLIRGLIALALALPFVNPTANAAKSIEGLVNINTATVEQLTLLPGVGTKKAEAIVAHRQITPFKQPADLAQVKGIGDKMVEKLSAHLIVTGETTARSGSAPAVKPSAANPANVPAPRS